MMLRMLLIVAITLAAPLAAQAKDDGRVAPPLAELLKAKSLAAGAEVLYSYDRRDVDDDHHWRSVHYRAIRINTLEAARDYGRIRISYNHYYSDLQLDFAQVLTEGGEVKPLESDALQELVGGGQDFYEDRTTLTFSLPDIKPGAVLEFQYRKTSKALALPSVFSDTSFSYWYQPTVGGTSARMDPVHQARYELVVPKSMVLHKKPVGPVKPKTKIVNEGDRRHHIWQWRDMPELHVERAMPSLRPSISHVSVSTSTDWGEVAGWTWELMRDKLEPTPAIRALAASLVAPDASDDEKIRAVYGYVQNNIRYVFAHLGRGGYEPHAADLVIQQGYGDCKDQTVVVLSLLRAMGVEAYPVLVVTSQQDQPDKSLVALPFDHVMTWIPGGADGSDLWLDTTGDRGLYPGFSSYLNGRLALIIKDDKSSQLLNIDADLPDNSAWIDLHYHVSDESNLMVDMEVNLSGLYEQNTRNWWINDSERESNLQLFVKDIFPQGDIQSLDAKILNADSLWQPVVVQAAFNFGLAWPEGKKSLRYSAGLHQALRLFGDLGNLQSPEKRHNPWLEDYAIELGVKAHFEAAGLTPPALLESGADVKSRFFTIEQEGSGTDEAYDLTIRYNRGPLNLPVKSYREYYAAIQDLNKLGTWTVAFAEDQTKTTETALERNAVTDKAPEGKLELARFYIKQGRYQEALAPAQAVVESDSGNGEAWYLLGSAQGFNGMVDESIKSFEKAASLGYIPQ